MPRHRRLTAVLAGLLLVPTLAVVALEVSPAGAVGEPVVLNNGSQNGSGGQYLESQSLADGDGVTQLFATFLVQHPVGRTITNVRVDRDWNGNDDTGNAANNVAVTPQFYSATGGANSLQTDRVTVAVNTGSPGGFSCPVFGSTTRRRDLPVRFRVVDNTGVASTTTLTQTVHWVHGNDNCTVTTGSNQDYPYMKPSSQTASEVTTGGSVNFTFSCNDEDLDVASSDDSCDRANLRLRNLANGDVTNLSQITGIGDDSNKTFTVTFPNRGYFVVEGQLCNESGSCPDTGVPSQAWWRFGAVAVNDPATSLSGSIGFSGADNSSSPPSINPTASVNAVASVGDSGGQVEVIEWDATGDGTYERLDSQTPTSSGGDVVLANLNSTNLTQAINASTPGTKVVKARITDNGAMDAADNLRRQLSFTGTLLVNALPTAQDVSTTTNEDTPVVVNMNGSDPDNQPDPLTYTVVSGPPASAGVLGPITGNHVTFTPALNFNGTTSFMYHVADGTAGTHGAHATSADKKVTITVNPVNDLPTVNANSITTDEDTPGIAHMTGNDVEDGTNLSFTAANGAHGTATCNASDDCTYTPNADFNGSDSFVVTVHDSEGGTATVTVPVTVNPVNDAPVATDDTVHVTEDDPSFGITLTASDIDSTVLTFSGPDDDVDHGTLSCIAQACTYTPDANYHGPDQFTFTVSDGALTDSGTIDIVVDSVNDAPVAIDVPDAVTDEDVAVGVPANGTDVDGDTVTVSSATDPANGTTQLTGPNEVTYQGDLDFNGTDLFDFTVVDGNGGSDVGHVQVTVNPVNDAPVAADQAFTIAEDTPEVLSIVGSDVDGDLLSWSLVSQGSHGHVVGTGPDAIYVPNHDFHGDDTFVVKVSDGQLSDTATITVHVTPVNDQPVADSGTVTTDEDTSATFSLVGSDPDTGDSLTYTVDSSTSNGSLGCANEACTYTPDADFNGADHLTFTVSDGNLTDSASVTIVVTPVNDTPVALPTLVSTNEDTPVAVPLTVTDVDGDALTYSVDTPAFGTFEGIAPDLVYVPNLNASGVETITYSVDDGHGGTAGNVIGITVNAVNDAPVATGGSIATDEDTPVGFLLGGTDVEGDPLTFTVDTAPPASAGALSCDTAGACTFDPTPNTSGDQAIAYTVSDGSLSSSAVFTVIVDPVNDPPVAADQPVATSEDTAVSITLAATDTEGDQLTYSAGAAAHGTVACTDASCVYTPAPNYNGPDSFTFTADDGTATSNNGTVTITVTPVNDAPQALDIAKETNEDTPVNILLMATDVDGDPITFTIDTPPAHGTVTSPGTGMAVTYTPATDFGGTDSFTYRATDPSGAFTTGKVSLVVDELPLIATSVRGEASVAKVKVTLVGLLTSINATLFPNLVAHLTDASGAPVAGKPLTFTIGSTNLCTATTDATGTATCASGIITGIQSLLTLGYKVTFAGDDDYLPSNGKGSVATVIVLAL